MIHGKRLVELREQLNLTAEELAQAIGVSRQQIARYEAERTDITSETLLKIADFFDVTTDYLLGRSDVKQGYERRGHFARLELDRLIKLSPKAAARLIKALGVQVEPNPLVIDEAELLKKLPAEYVADFLKFLGLEPRLASSPDSPESG